MERLTTEIIETNFQYLMNFSFAKDGEVWLRDADQEEDIPLADYIAREAANHGCHVLREDVLHGDACWECECPLTLLNVAATQGAELRARLKAYEDAEAEGRLVVLPCKVGDEIYRIVKPSGMCKKFVPMLPDKVAPFGIYYRNVMGGYSYIPLDDIGKTVFLTREEAEAALCKWPTPCKHGISRHRNEIGEDEVYCEINARWMNVTLGDCLGNCEAEAKLKGENTDA